MTQSPYFANADPDFITAVVVSLQYEVVQPGDIVVEKGTKGKKMYFILEGVVYIMRDEDELTTSLSDGSYFGGD